MIILLLATVAAALSAPVTLELSGGSVIKGDLVSWNGQQAVAKAEFGSMTFRRNQLSQHHPKASVAASSLASLPRIRRRELNHPEEKGEGTIRFLLRSHALRGNGDHVKSGTG